MTELIARTVRWARQNGWQPGFSGWENGGVRVNLNDGGFTVERRINGRWPIFPAGRTYIAVESARQAVDLLVAYGILPPELSSAYEAGQNDALFVGYGRSEPPPDGTLVIAEYQGGHQNIYQERVLVRCDRNEGAYPDGDYWVAGTDKPDEHPWTWGEVLWLDDPPCDRGSVGLTYYVPTDERGGR